MDNCLNPLTKIKVRGYHLDLYGHVNNTRYLEFLKEARWNVKDLFFDIPKLHNQDLNLVVVNININYRASARLDDVLEIFTKVSRIGHKSVTLKQEIFFENTDKVVADAEVTFVIYDKKMGKAVELPAEIRQQFGRLATSQKMD